MEHVYQFLYSSKVNYPSRPFVTEDRCWTYDEVCQYTGKLTDFLLKKGVRENDKVILYIENSVEYVISFFAVLKAGAVVIPITTTSTKAWIEDIVSESDAALILTSSKLLQKIENVSYIASDKIMVVDLDKIADLENCQCLEQYKNNEVAMFIYTSGTTSKSKGVMLSHKNLITNTESILSYLKLGCNDKILATLPFTYSYGNSILLTHTRAGASMHICKQENYIQVVLSLLEQGDYTGFSTVGSYIKLLVSQKNFTRETLEKLRYITLAGEQSSKESVLQIHEMLPELKIYIMYGQTEASARISYLEPDRLVEKCGSVGKGIKGVTIKIVNEDRKEAEPYEKGEIIVQGDNIMLGYWKRPEETEEVLKDNWLYTNDIGYMDLEGYLYVVGRKNDIIKYLGHRISPLEIENYINKSENIAESAVVDWHDKDDNVKIVAFVVLKTKGDDVSYLKKDLRKVLPVFKVPSAFYIVEELPRTSNGKIKRKDLKLRLEEDDGKKDIW